MSVVMINNAIVMSQRTGESSRGVPKIGLHISEKVYDPEYPNRLRFNNYWVTAHGETAEKVVRMGIKDKSSVNVVAKMDYMRATSQGNPPADEDGRNRFVKGLLFELLDISYAVGGGAGEEPEENAAEEQKPLETREEQKPKSKEVPVINLDERNILLEGNAPRGRVYGGTLK